MIILMTVFLYELRVFNYLGDVQFICQTTQLIYLYIFVISFCKEENCHSICLHYYTETSTKK
jgi:hypothetical protein